MALTLGMVFKFYASVAKGLKLKVRKFWGLIPTFSEVYSVPVAVVISYWKDKPMSHASITNFVGTLLEYLIKTLLCKNI